MVSSGRQAFAFWRRESPCGACSALRPSAARCPIEGSQKPDHHKTGCQVSRAHDRDSPQRSHTTMPIVTTANILGQLAALPCGSA